MNAIQVVAPHEARITTIPEPTLAAGSADVLLRVERMGLCGTDLKTYRGENPLVEYPRIIGHELCGAVVAAGAGATVRIGQRAAVFPYLSCGSCSSCRKGRFNACKFNLTLGVQRDGGGTQLITVPDAALIPLDDLDADTGALVEPLSVAYHAVRRAQLAAGESVAVMGCGMIGLGVILAAAAQGARVIAVDVDERKTAAARALGATEEINLSREELGPALRARTDGHGPDVIIEAVGSAATFRQAVEEVAFCGRVVYIGYAADIVSYEPKLFVSKELDVRGSRNATPEDFQAVVAMIRGGGFDLSTLITQRYSANDAPAALDYWSKNTRDVTKIMLTF